MWVEYEKSVQNLGGYSYGITWSNTLLLCSTAIFPIISVTSNGFY